MFYELISLHVMSLSADRLTHTGLEHRVHDFIVSRGRKLICFWSAVLNYSSTILDSKQFCFFQIRMQAQGNVIQGSMMGNFINIYQEEGTRGLWKVGQALFKCMTETNGVNAPSLCIRAFL